MLGDLPEPGLLSREPGLLHLELLLGAPAVGESSSTHRKASGAPCGFRRVFDRMYTGQRLSPALFRTTLLSDGEVPAEPLPVEVEQVRIGGRHERGQLAPDEARAIDAGERGGGVVGFQDRAGKIQVQMATGARS